MLGSAGGGLSARSYLRRTSTPRRPLNQKSARNIWLTLIGCALSRRRCPRHGEFFAASLQVSPLSGT